MKKQKTHRHKQSFTLIELLIVIAIIAILAAVIVANVTSAQAQARDVRRTQDLDQLKTALEMYYFDHNSYPYPTNSDQGFCIEQNQSFKEDLIDGDYISSLPQDPLYNADQCTNPSNTDCHCYIYRTETEDKYKLFAKTEQQDFKPAKQDGGPYNDRYEAYAPVQGANKIVLGWPWYEAGPYLSGIVGAWSFDEGFGPTAYDTSGNNNNGTLINGPTWVDGKFGKALSFDGVDDYVDCGNDESLDITDAITLEAWVYGIDWSPTNRTKAIVCKFGGIPADRSYYIGVLDGMPRGSINTYTFDSNMTIALDSWHHIVLTYDRIKKRIYVDGIMRNEADLSDQILVTAVDLIIGSRSDLIPMDHFNGLIDEVRIYNRALSAEEIADLYAAGGD